MSPKNIIAGQFYFDGKLGMREVLAIDTNTGEVTYRLLSTKASTRFDWQAKKMVATAGEEKTMTLTAFAGWAKERIDACEAPALLQELEGSKVRLSPGEEAFARSVLKELGAAPKVGTHISFAQSEQRAVIGLKRKGLVDKHPTDEVSFTELGAGKLRAMAREAVATV